MLSESEARERIRALENGGEKRVNTLLLDLGFEAVDFNVRIFDENGQEIGEIDSLFVFEDHLLITETTIKADLETDSIVAWVSKWSDETNINRIFTKYKLSPRFSHRLFFWLSRERPRRLSPNLMRVLRIRSNKIIFLDEVARYEENFNIVGIWERNNFLNFLEIKKDRVLKQIPAVLFYVSDKPAYTFGLSAKELLEICFISRRYKNELGFQRAINKKRVDRIRRAIERKEVLTFPNSILINSLYILLPNKPPRHECPANILISLPQDYSSCKVIDGQHRLLGFSKASEELARSYNLPVVAFEQLTSREEVDTFVVINSEQRRVDANLVLLLKSDSDWPEGSDFFMQKIAVNVVKKLDENSCLTRKIFMGYADQKRADTWVTLATLVRAMIANKFVSRRGALFQESIQDIEKPYKEIRRLFAKMRRVHFPYFVDSRDRFFLTNRGLRILFRFVHLFHRNTRAGNISIQFEEAIGILARTIDETIKRQLESYYGEGGARRAVTELVEFLKDTNEEFRNFETDLRRV